MASEVLRPTGISANGGGTTPTGGTRNAVTADDSDSTYVDFATPGSSAMVLALTNPSVSDGLPILGIKARAKVKRTGGSGPRLRGLLTTATGGSDDPEGSNVVTWTSPTTVELIPLSPLPDGDLDNLQYAVWYTGSGPAALRVYELYADIVYVPQPTLTVDAPTGTITTETLPETAWSATLDSDGGAQTHFEVKLYTDAQYGAGGFDPDSSTPTATSGVVVSSASSWTPTGDPLADDTYRAYVRVAQMVDGEPYWSEWANEDFVIDVEVPAAPTVVVTPEPSGGRMLIEAVEAPFSPESISGLQVWLKADAITGLADADPISTWEDSSSANHDATAAGGRRPLYKTGILNGLPVVRFDGFDDEFTLGDISAAFPTAATLFAVVTLTSDSTYAIYETTGVSGFWSFSDTAYMGAFRGARFDNFATSMPSSGTKLFSLVSSASTYEMWIDAVSKGSAAANYSAGSTHYIAREPGDSGHLAGDIGELLVYDSALSTEDRQAIEDYLTEKWGL